MPQVPNKPLWVASNPINGKYQKPGGVTVLATTANPPNYVPHGTSTIVGG